MFKPTRRIFGGSAKKDYDRTQDDPRKRGLGTMKDAVFGAVSRAGHVVAQLIPDISGETIANFIRDNLDTENAIPINSQDITLFVKRWNMKPLTEVKSG